MITWLLGIYAKVVITIEVVFILYHLYILVIIVISDQMLCAFEQLAFSNCTKCTIAGIIV